MTATTRQAHQLKPAHVDSADVKATTKKDSGIAQHPKTPLTTILLKTAVTLMALVLLTPVSMTLIFLAKLYRRVFSAEQLQQAKPADKAGSAQQKKKNTKTVMLTGAKMTKSLQLARLFSAAGHRVVMVETHKYWLSGHRYSKAVSAFRTVPSPAKDPKGYIDGLVKIAIEEKVDLFVPVSSPVSSYYSALAKPQLSKHCTVLTFDAETCKTLDDKFLFCKKAAELGLSIPQAHLITDPQQLVDFNYNAPENAGRRYIVKSICYDSVTRLDLTRLPCPNVKEFASKLPISKERPWVMQEFIKGQEYCTHSLCRDGKVLVHCCSPSSAFQVNYTHVHKPKIYAWVEKFAKEMNLTGQASFDFIETPSGDVFPIECNPRTHTAVSTFHDHPCLADAYVEPSNLEGVKLPIEPLPTSKPTYWLAHEAWRLMQARSLSEVAAILQKVASGQDAMLSAEDPMPFLMVHHWQIPLLLFKAFISAKEWVRIDFNIGKLVEVGGD